MDFTTQTPDDSQQSASPAMGSMGALAGAFASMDPQRKAAMATLVDGLSKQNLGNIPTGNLLSMLGQFMPPAQQLFKAGPGDRILQQDKLGNLVEIAGGANPLWKDMTETELKAAGYRPGTTAQRNTATNEIRTKQQDRQSLQAQFLDDWASLAVSSAKGELTDDPKSLVKLDAMTQQLTKPIVWTDQSGVTHREDPMTMTQINKYLAQLSVPYQYAKDKDGELVRKATPSSGAQPAGRQTAGAATPLTGERDPTQALKNLGPQEIQSLSSVKIAQKAAGDAVSKFFDENGNIDRTNVLTGAMDVPFTEGRGASADLMRAVSEYRHALYGSQLTEGEKKSFAQAFLPQAGDSDEAIRRKLRAVFDMTHNYQEIYKTMGLRGPEVDKFLGPQPQIPSVLSDPTERLDRPPPVVKSDSDYKGLKKGDKYQAMGKDGKMHTFTKNTD